MNRSILLILSLFITFSGWNCASNDTHSSTDAQGNETAVAGDEAGKEHKAPENPRKRVWVDDLRVRKGPGAEAEVVGELKEGQIVEYLGESSPEQHTATLRGQKITAPWMKVKLPDGGEGWVFGGALQEAGESSGGGSAGPFTQYLAGLPEGSCEDLPKAAQKLKTDYASADAATQDAAIRAFYDYYQEMIVAQEKIVFAEDADPGFELLGYNEDNRPIPGKVKDQVAKWKRCGVDLWFPEGITSPTEDHTYMADNFGKMGSPAMQEYLKQMKTELKEGFSADAGLMITPKQLAERIVFWQRFRDKHPGFKPLGGPMPGFHGYIGFFMTGLDNTPAFDWGEKNDLYPEWKAAYEWVMKEVPGTEAGKAVKEYYDLLKMEGFKRSQKVIDHSNKYWEKHNSY